VICNGIKDCANGADEKYCIMPSVRTAMKRMSNEKIPLDSKVDETYNSTLYQNNSIRCRNKKFGWVIARTCDGHIFCTDLEDECDSGCKNPPPFCNIKNQCLTGARMCNGEWDSDRLCPNGRILEEEIGCPNRFYCKSGKRISVRMDEVIYFNNY